MDGYKDYTDAELVTLLKDGDRKAFEVIYTTYVKQLYRYAQSLIHTKEDSEEIVQDVFEKLWMMHPTMDIQSLRPYLIKCVRNKVMDYFDRNAVKKKYADRYRFFEAVYDSVEEDDRNSEAIYTMIEQGIQNLPDHLQQAILLRLNENLSSKEIASRMNLSRGTVDVYISNVNARLRSLYLELYGEGK